MNKVITINLSGRLITIDDSAYQQLSAYLKWLQQFFSNEEGGQEIYSDMEDRIAELFQDKLKKGGVSISEDDVQAVIRIMGSPEQIAMENAENLEEPKHAKIEDQQGFSAQASEVPSRLTRNLSDKVLGGVCSGVAAHFGLDPVLIRILMVIGTLVYGSGAFLYILLWIFLPAAHYSTRTQLKRRLYRADEGKVIGGVCQGLSYPLKVDVKWIRLIFAFPILGAIFFNIINENDLASFCEAGVPTLSILYIVLWIALPRANSVTELMDLKGERLDVQNISEALKVQNARDLNAPVPEQTNVFGSIIKVFGYIVLGFVLLIVGSILLALLAVLFGVLFGFSTAGLAVMPLANLLFENNADSYVLYISCILLVLIPIVAIIRWLSFRVRRTQNKSRWVSYTLGILFISSLFAVFYIFSELRSDFTFKYDQTNSLPMMQPTDTLEISSQNRAESSFGRMNHIDLIQLDSLGRFQLPLASLKVLPSENDSFYMQLERKSNGASAAQAASLANEVSFNYRYDSSKLYLPELLTLSKTQLFRGQLLTAKVFVPKGRYFKIGDIPSTYGKSWSINSVPFTRINIHNEYWAPNSLYKMGENGRAELVD